MQQTMRVSNQSTSYESIVITEQPSVTKTTEIQHPKELEIEAVIKTLDQRELQFFKATNNYSAYSQQIYYTDSFKLSKLRNLFCCESPFTECYSGNQLTIAYSDKTVEKININPSFFFDKNIAFHANDNEVVVLDNSNINSKLYLIKLKEFRQYSTNASKIEINIPQENILTVAINPDSELYIVSIGKNQLCLWSCNPTIENNKSDNNDWGKLTINVLVDSIADVAFSENGRYLFVRLNNGTLNLYDSNVNWSQIAEVANTTSFPIDIYNNLNIEDTDEDDHTQFMVFIKDQTLTIKSFTNDLLFSDEYLNKLTVAHFIPNTKDLLVFDTAGNIILTKYDNIKDSFYRNFNARENLPYKIKKVYFDSDDNTKLLVLAEKKAIKLIKEKHQKTNDDCAECGILIPWVISCVSMGECFSGTCCLQVIYGYIVGNSIDYLDGFIDKNYFLTSTYANVKKTITPGDIVEPKTLVIQRSVTNV